MLAEVRERMTRLFSVKLLLIAMLGCARAADALPDARELLKMARAAQSELNWKFNGHLRIGSGAKKIPFMLTIANGVIRYEFQDTRDTLTLRLGETDSRLEETKGGKPGRITAAKADEPVRDTSITYEDLAMRFLYWRDAKVLDSDVIATRSSWEVEILPPAGTATQYSKVKVWLAKEDNALMKMEAFDSNGKLVRKYVARSFMKRDGYWFLKQMEITGPGTGAKRITILELDDVAK
jgi:Outer membrane lipoprotein-sorting protein